MLHEQILSKLDSIERKLSEQTLLQKEVLSVKETCFYLSMSESNLYKLTSSKQIPHYCPQGKKLYFNRQNLDDWLQRNHQSSNDQIEKLAINYTIQHKLKK